MSKNINKYRAATFVAIGLAIGYSLCQAANANEVLAQEQHKTAVGTPSIETCKADADTARRAMTNRLSAHSVVKALEGWQAANASERQLHILKLAYIENDLFISNATDKLTQNSLSTFENKIAMLCMRNRLLSTQVDF